MTQEAQAPLTRNKMQPKISHTAQDLNLVLQNPTESEEIVYQVFSVEEPTNNKWVNKTVINPGKIGEEYNKTHGHYHTTNPHPELYKVEEGEGILILQKKHEILLVKAKAGDQILIEPEYGHSWSNTGSTPLILLDNWSFGHSEEDYVFIDKHHGMAYCLAPEPSPNPNYQDLPQPIWVTPQQLPQGV